MKPQITKLIIEIFDKAHAPIAKVGRSLGITANHLTFLQLPFIAIMFYYLIKSSIFLAALSLLISLYLDLLDGSWARTNNETNKKGHTYDKIVDLIGIIAFLGGIWIIFPELQILILALLVANFILYAANIFTEPELYCGVRSFGLLGLIFLSKLEIFILIPTIICITMIIYKIWGHYAKR